jgi:hypothetical protein
MAKFPEPEKPMELNGADQADQPAPTIS